MGRAAGADQPRLVETGQITETWIDGIARIEPLGGGTYRFVLYQKHECPDGTIENEIAASLLTNLSALESAAASLRALLAGAVAIAPTLM